MSHKLIEVSSGAEVKPGMTCIDFRNQMWKLVSFKPGIPPSTGRVFVKPVEGDSKMEHEFYPAVFGFKIVEEA